MSAPPPGPGGTSGPGSRVEVVSLLAAAAATALVLMLPRPDGLSVEGQRAAALFAGVLILWSTEALPLGVTSMLVLVLQALFNLTTLVAAPRPPTTSNILGAAIVNFMSPAFFFVLVMFIIAFAWVKTGLDRRFALWMISPGGHRRPPGGVRLHVRHRPISTIMSDVPCAAIFMAIALGLFDRLGLRPGIAVRPGRDDGHPDRVADRRRGDAGGQLDQHARPELHRAVRGAARSVPALDGDRRADGRGAAAGGGLGARAVLPARNRHDRPHRGHRDGAAGAWADQRQRVEGDRGHVGDARALDREHVGPGDRRHLVEHRRRVRDVPARASSCSPGRRRRARTGVGHAADDRRRHVARHRVGPAPAWRSGWSRRSLGGLQDWPPAMLIAAISAFTVVIHLVAADQPGDQRRR